VRGAATLILAAAACGRLHFDPASTNGDAADGATVTPPAGPRLVVGYQNACMLDKGNLLCWGANTATQLGAGPMVQPLPIAVGTGHVWIDVAIGRNHMCALDDAKEAWCWGSYSQSQLGLALRTCGNGSLDANEACDDANQENLDGCDCMCQARAQPPDEPNPQPLPDRFQFDRLFAGLNHTCGIRVDGTLWCWGSNGSRQLGVGDGGGSADHSVPLQVVVVAPQVGADNDWMQVGTGDDHTCAIKQDNSLWCWGSNASGQLGQLGNPTIVRERPELVLGGTIATYSQVTGGIDFECAIGTDRRIYCLGRNDTHQLGLGASVSPSDVPVLTSAQAYDVIASGTAHACALRDDHVVECWGQNTRGATGIAAGPDVTTPTALAGTWNALDTGQELTCALDQNDAPWCWGAGGSGQLGNGMTQDSSVPVRVMID
jgi:cysteine-rich repeat protein